MPTTRGHDLHSMSQFWLLHAWRSLDLIQTIENSHITTEIAHLGTDTKKSTRWMTQQSHFHWNLQTSCRLADSHHSRNKLRSILIHCDQESWSSFAREIRYDSWNSAHMSIDSLSPGNPWCFHTGLSTTLDNRRGWSASTTRTVTRPWNFNRPPYPNWHRAPRWWRAPRLSQHKTEKTHIENILHWQNLSHSCILTRFELLHLILAFDQIDRTTWALRVFCPMSKLAKRMKNTASVCPTLLADPYFCVAEVVARSLGPSDDLSRSVVIVSLFTRTAGHTFEVTVDFCSCRQEVHVNDGFGLRPLPLQAAWTMAKASGNSTSSNMPFQWCRLLWTHIWHSLVLRQWRNGRMSNFWNLSNDTMCRWQMDFTHIFSRHSTWWHWVNCSVAWRCRNGGRWRRRRRRNHWKRRFQESQWIIPSRRVERNNSDLIWFHFISCRSRFSQHDEHSTKSDQYAVALACGGVEMIPQGPLEGNQMTNVCVEVTARSSMEAGQDQWFDSTIEEAFKDVKLPVSTVPSFSWIGWRMSVCQVTQVSIGMTPSETLGHKSTGLTSVSWIWLCRRRTNTKFGHRKRESRYRKRDDSLQLVMKEWELWSVRENVIKRIPSAKLRPPAEADTDEQRSCRHRQVTRRSDMWTKFRMSCSSNVGPKSLCLKESTSNQETACLLFFHPKIQTRVSDEDYGVSSVDVCHRFSTWHLGARTKLFFLQMSRNENKVCVTVVSICEHAPDCLDHRNSEDNWSVHGRCRESSWVALTARAGFRDSLFRSLLKHSPESFSFCSSNITNVRETCSKEKRDLNGRHELASSTRGATTWTDFPQHKPDRSMIFDVRSIFLRKMSVMKAKNMNNASKLGTARTLMCTEWCFSCAYWKGTLTDVWHPKSQQFEKPVWRVGLFLSWREEESVDLFFPWREEECAVTTLFRGLDSRHVDGHVELTCDRVDWLFFSQSTLSARSAVY